MSTPPTDALVLGFPASQEPARRMAQAAGLRYADVDAHRFPDGESRVRLPEQLPPHVVCFSSLDHPNSKLIELVLAAGAAPDLGAERLTLIAPYLCYMRQDVAFQPGEAVSQRIIGDLLARYFDTLITVDPHLHRTHELHDAVPVRRALSLTATAPMAEWLAERGGTPLLIGPDSESVQWVSALAAPAGLDFGVARKERLGDRDVRIALPDIHVDGREVLLVDDMVSTGRTLIEAALELRAAGATSITALVTHALFVGDAVQQLNAAGVGEIVSTDSVAHPSNTISLAATLAAALNEIDRQNP